MLSWEALRQRRERIRSDNGHQGGVIKRIAAGPGDDAGVCVTAIPVYVKDDGGMALEILQIGGNQPVFFDALFDDVDIFAKREALGVKNSAVGTVDGLLFALEYFEAGS